MIVFIDSVLRRDERILYRYSTENKDTGRGFICRTEKSREQKTENCREQVLLFWKLGNARRGYPKGLSYQLLCVPFYLLIGTTTVILTSLPASSPGWDVPVF
jgi:hypothetical protein